MKTFMNITNYRSKSNNPVGSSGGTVITGSNTLHNQNLINNQQFMNNRLPPSQKQSSTQNQAPPQLMGIGNGIQPQAFNSNNNTKSASYNYNNNSTGTMLGVGNNGSGVNDYSRINNNNQMQPTVTNQHPKINSANNNNTSNSFQQAQIVGNSFIKQQVLTANTTTTNTTTFTQNSTGSYPSHHKKDQSSMSKINSSKEMQKDSLATQLHTPYQGKTSGSSTNENNNPSEQIALSSNSKDSGVRNNQSSHGHNHGSHHPHHSNHATNSNQIIIHVCDENKKMNKDFKCDRVLLLTHMKYFEKYLADSKNLDDIDISVHCDINIFDWLMRYVHRREPKLEIKNSVSILISSDFLQMSTLVDESVQFVVKNIQEIITLPIDMNCLNSQLIKKLARQITLEDLDNLKDKKDKLTSKLFMKKLEILFEDEANMLHRCVYCDQLYTSGQREWMQCPRAKIFIDTHGTVIAQHVSDKTWDVNKFVMFLRQKTVPWKDIFMKIYARLQEFNCSDCNFKFIGAEINHCSYHTIHAKFSFGSNNGYYPCCNATAQRFSISVKKTGCTSKNHSIKIYSPKKYHNQENSQKIFDLLMKHFQEVCEPYEFEKANAHTGEVEIIKKLTDCINSERSLMKFVKAFLQQKEQSGTADDQDEDEDAGDKSDSSDEEDACDVLNSELLAQQQQTAALLSLKKKKKQKYKEWRMDTLRNDDFSQMKLMAKELQKLRKDDKFLRKAQTGRRAGSKDKTTLGGQGNENSQRPQTGNNTSNQIRNRVQQHYSKARQNKIRR